MKQELPLWHRVYYTPLYTDLCRIVGYLGFSAREVAERLKPLAQQHGAKKLSLALFETMTFEGNRVMLNRKARALCGSLLGPPPERRKEFYENPRDRPADWDQEIEIPKGGPDPIMEGLSRLTATQMDIMLRQAWANRNSTQEHVASLACEQIPCIESEMLRRGQEIPKEEPEKKEEPKKKRAKKAS